MPEYPHDHRHYLPGISEAEWQTLLGYLREATFTAGERLYEPGGRDRLLTDRALLFLRAGRIVVRPIDDEMEIDIVPPAVMGRAVFFTGELVFVREVTAAEEIDTLVLTHEAFQRLAADHPRLALHLAMDNGSELALTVGGRAEVLRQHGIHLPSGEGRP